MLIRLLDHSAFQTARTALTGLSRRQEATASNIANIDTPGYRRREVTFEDALRRTAEGQRAASNGAVNGAQGSGGRLVRTDPRHIAHPGMAAAGAPGQGTAAARDVVSSRNDANTVSVDEEMTTLVETQIRYQALSQTVSQRLGTLRTVIRGG